MLRYVVSSNLQGRKEYRCETLQASGTLTLSRVYQSIMLLDRWTRDLRRELEASHLLFEGTKEHLTLPRIEEIREKKIASVTVWSGSMAPSLDGRKN